MCCKLLLPLEESLYDHVGLKLQLTPAKPSVVNPGVSSLIAHTPTAESFSGLWEPRGCEDLVLTLTCFHMHSLKFRFVRSLTTDLVENSRRRMNSKLAEEEIFALGIILKEGSRE